MLNKRKYKQRYRDEKRQADVNLEMIRSLLLGVGLHPTGLQALGLPSFKTKERAQSQWQRHQWFSGWGDLTCLKQGRGVTPHRLQQTVGRTWQQSLLQGEGEVTSYRRIDVRLAHRLPTVRHAPHCFFDELSHYRGSDLKISHQLGLGASL